MPPTESRPAASREQSREMHLNHLPSMVLQNKEFCVGWGPGLLGLAGAGPAGSEENPPILVAGDFVYRLEGAIYTADAAQIEHFLAQALRAESAPRCAALVKDFIATADGEFVLAAQHCKTGRALLFNDILGRLPLFMAKGPHDSGLIIGRSLRAIQALQPAPVRPDRLGIAARLLFGYPLDARTELEGIESFPESGLAWVAAAGAAPVVLADEVDYGGARREECVSAGANDDEVARLGEELVQACARRVQRLAGWTPTLALSGGFDSRLVACALKQTGAFVETITRTDHLSAPADATTAARVADALGFRHHLITCGEIHLELIRKLAGIGEGGLAVDVGHMLGFLEKAREQLGPQRFLLTGDGGDKTVAPLLPLGRLTMAGEVMRMMSAVSTPEMSACVQLTGLSKSDICEYIDQALRGQPGRTVPEKVRALAFRQRGRRWLNLGEDRNRTVFWSTTPFYAPAFFFRANAIPDGLKQRDQLYLRLLAWFDDRLARIPRPGRGQHRLSDRLLLEGHLQLSRSPFLTRVYRCLKPASPIPPFRLKVEEDLAAARILGGGIWDLCDSTVLAGLLQNPPSESFRSQLLTLALWRGPQPGTNILGRAMPPGGSG